jgi:hypothetical protein
MDTHQSRQHASDVPRIIARAPIIDDDRPEDFGRHFHDAVHHDLSALVAAANANNVADGFEIRLARLRCRLRDV